MTGKGDGKAPPVRAVGGGFWEDAPGFQRVGKWKYAPKNSIYHVVVALRENEYGTGEKLHLSKQKNNNKSKMSGAKKSGAKKFRSPPLASLVYCLTASLIVLHLLIDFNCFIVSGNSGYGLA